MVRIYCPILTEAIAYSDGTDFPDFDRYVHLLTLHPGDIGLGKLSNCQSK